jgi:hypothetical protein
VYGWRKKLGCTYEPKKKCYYVDGHEKEATVNYRWCSIECYLGYGKRMFHWIQITKQDASALEDEGIIAKNGGTTTIILRQILTMEDTPSIPATCFKNGWTKKHSLEDKEAWDTLKGACQ